MKWVCYETPRPRTFDRAAKKWHQLTGDTSVDGNLVTDCAKLLKPSRIVESATKRICQTCASRARARGEPGPLGIETPHARGN